MLLLSVGAMEGPMHRASSAVVDVDNDMGRDPAAGVGGSRDGSTRGESGGEYSYGYYYYYLGGGSWTILRLSRHVVSALAMYMCKR